MKRFAAADMREGIRLIRADLGADAVILSSQKTAQGIEITAAVDYDEQDVEPIHSGLRRDSVQDAPNWPENRYPTAGQQPGLGGFERERRVEELTQQGAPKSNRNQSPRLASAPAPSVDYASPNLDEPGNSPRKPPTNLRQPAPSSRKPASNPSASSSSLEQLGHEIRDLRGLLLHQLSSLGWSDLERRHPLRASVLRRLMDLGLSRRVGGMLVEKIPETLSSKAAWQRALALLAHAIPVQQANLMDKGGVIALLGPTGVGKTTTAAKLAARFALQNGSRNVALITTDSYRIGAHEQLRTFAQIMDIPLRVAHDEASLRQALSHFYDRRLVLIDTAGMSQRDVRFSEQINLIGDGSPLVRNYLVVSSTTQMLAVEETIKAFSQATIEACVITKLDETTSLGGTLSALIQHRIPAAYLGDGQRVPEDLKVAKAHGLVTKAITIAHLTNAQADHALPGGLDRGLVGDLAEQGVR